MLAVHAGYIQALLGTIRPPAARLAMRVAPTGMGDQSGTNWANAAPLSALNSIIATAATLGAEVWLRADAGTYSYTAALTISNGGSVGHPVVIRGVDVNGADMFAEIIGGRAGPLWSAGQTGGSDLFRLNSGADNLTFRFVRFRNIGAGCIRPRQPIVNLTIEDIEAYNVGRCIANNGATTASDATVVGLTIKRLKVEGFSKYGITLRYDTRNVLIEDCFMDGMDIDGDRISCGVQLDDRARDGIIRRVRVVNVMNAGPGSYYNGDGFSGERGNDNWLVEDCSAENISDGALDMKGDGLIIRRFRGKFCKRTGRFWGDCLVEDMVSEYPTSRGGSGASCHIFAMQHGKARVRVKGGTFIQSSNNAAFRVADQGLIAVDAAAQAGVTKPSGAPMFAQEASDLTDALFGVWNHADTTAPAITGSLALTSPENTPSTYRIAVSENANLRLRGPDADKVFMLGRTLNLYTQDYDVSPGPAADGSKVLKFEIQALDVNDNVSPWYPVTIAITDRADDPISPAQAIAASGATGGFWYDIANAGSLWANTARTEQAVVGGEVACVDDLTGFGNHLVFDEERRPILRVVGGYTGLEFGGADVGKIGATGGLRFPQLTAFTVFDRDREDYDPSVSTSSALIFTGRRSLTATGGDNTMFTMEVVDTSFARVRVFGGSVQSIGLNNGAPHGKPYVLSFRSADGTLRRDGGVLETDGADVPTVSYPRTGEQPLLGGRLAYDGTLVSVCQGIFYGAAMLNRTLDDDTRSRIERQLAQSGGREL